MASKSDTQSPKQKKVYPRKLTDKRREQNRQAQKVYRDKQKRKIEELERKVEANASASDPMASESSRTVSPGEQTNPVALPPLSTGDNTAFVPDPTADIESYIDNPTNNFAELDLAFQDAPVFTLPGDPFAIAPEQTNVYQAGAAAASLPTYQVPTSSAAWPTPDLSDESEAFIPLESSQTLFPSDSDLGLTNEEPIEEITRSGGLLSPTIAGLDRPTLSTTGHIHSLSNSDPAFLQNHMTLKMENCLNALFEIANHLGITRDSYVNDHQSPFYTPAILDGTCGPPAVMAKAHREIYSYLKPDLRPSSAQVAYPHFSYIDCFPWPKFREKLMRASMEGKLNHMELFMDVLNDGMVCWGNVNRAKGTDRMGVAWDQRSWEARPWFIKKWKWLIGGDDEEIVRGSKWWRFMRGEKDDDE
ncbi:MAG: hypothetical protein Q9227_001255 [Pyrenula ochraceoflavens]